jgi:excisionase family DNA binding protein
VSDLEDMVRRIVRDELAKQTPANEEREWLSVADYARKWSVSQSTVRDACREKRLEFERVGRAVRIPANAKIARERVDEVEARARLVLLGGKAR